jgi:hypothetical protein
MLDGANAHLYNRRMKINKLPVRHVRISQIPNTYGYAVSYSTRGMSNPTIHTFSNLNRAKSFVRRNLDSKGAYTS